MLNGYLEKLAAWEQRAARTVELELVLSNLGSAPAVDIDAVLDFPDDLALLDRLEGLPKRPEPPEPPRRPQSFGVSYEALFRSAASLPTLSPDALNPVFAGPYVGQHQVRFPLDRLKHGFDEPLQAFYFCFPDRSAIRSFTIDFQLSAAELPDATAGKLHIVVSTG